MTDLKIIMMLACLVFLSACVSGQINRVDRGGQPEPELLEALTVGESSMQYCIEVLGAPQAVREHGQGAELIWGWERNLNYGVTSSIPLGRAASANVAYSQGSRGARGWTLRFDQNWILVNKQKGRLSDLLELSQPPPRLLEDSRGE